MNVTFPGLRSAGSSATRRIVQDASSLLFLAQLAAAAGALAANVITARALGPAGRGELTLLLQIAYFGSLGVLLGSDRSVVAIYTGYPLRVVAAAFLRLLARPSLVTLVLAAAVILLPLPALDSWHLRLTVAALFMVVNALGRAARSIAIACGRSRQYLGFALAEEGFRLSLLWPLYLLGYTDSALYLLAYLLAGLITGVGSVWFWWRRSAAADVGAPAANPAGPAEPVLRRRARVEGLHLVPATLAHNGSLRLDRFLIVGLASTAALGHYAPVATFTELIAWPLLAFADSRLGEWRQAYDRGTLSFRRSITLAVAYSVVAAAVMVVALNFLLEPLLGAEFSDAHELVVPLSIAAAVFGISQLLVNALTAVRRSPLSSVSEVVGLVVGLVACVLLIQRLGALGAAYGSLIGYSVCGGVAAFFLIRERRTRSLPTGGEMR